MTHISPTKTTENVGEEKSTYYMTGLSQAETEFVNAGYYLNTVEYSTV